ncbi:MAG TPA: hypothetical protein VII06_04445 [Chloroflexota bacterium]|jgi:hypothetical protein
MARHLKSAPKRARISIEVQPELRARLREAAAKRGLTLRQYVLETLEARLTDNPGGDERPMALTSGTDPVLAELWDNPLDAIYDRL